MNFDSFSHGQVLSKLWLCEQLEPHLPTNARILILGSWHNVLSFMMLTRKPNSYQEILGIDIDSSASEVADKINDCWVYTNKVKNITQDANSVDYTGFDCVVNCSGEHFEDSSWFNNIPKGTMVCVQSTNIKDPGDPWFIKQPTPTFKDFLELYKVDDKLYADNKKIWYGTWGYNRYMLIGRK
jgi:hypothetical protein